MDPTLTAILTALYQAHVTIDEQNHRIEMLRAELAAVRADPKAPE